MISELRSFQKRDLERLKQNLEGACAWLDLPSVLEEKLGPGVAGESPDITVACVEEEPVGVVVSCRDRIRLLAVKPSMRRRGLGTVLLAAAESSVSSRGHERVSCMDEAGNYVAPGIDAGDEETIAWMKKRGFEEATQFESLVISLVGNPKATEQSRDEAMARAVEAGYLIERLRAAEAPDLVAAVGKAHSAAWATEVERAGRDVFIARREGEVVAFAAHDGTNRGMGWFGPAATDPEHRGKGLGAALLLACLRDVAEQGHSECTISWIGPRTFYDRVAGIADTRRYLVLRKPIDRSE